MDQNHNAVGLYLYFVMAITMVSANVQGTEGESINITCSVAGTLPRWTKDITETLTLEGNTMINSAYSARFSYASDQKTLVVSSVQIGDAGRYVCSIGGIQGTTDVVISVLKSKKKTEERNGKTIQTTNCIGFVLVEVVVTVVIIICSYILINAYKERKHNNKMKDKQNNKIEDKHNNKMEDKHNIKMEDKQNNKMEDKQNNKMEDKHNNKMADKQNENKKKKKIKVVVILTIVEVLLFITVSVWFIVIQATVEDFEKLTTTEHIVTIILLVVEIVVFVQGVIAIFVFWKNRASPDFPTCDQCGGVKTPSSSGGDRSTAAVKPTTDNNPDPWKQRSVMKPIVKPKSGDTGQCHPDVSPQHRPQPAPPSNERHGSDLSSVSRRDVKLDPIPPIRKNNSTTEFHMDNPESERSNIKVSSRGLSAVFDQEYDQPPTNRLAPLDHTVRDESIRRKKKKKKTRTNNDNVKFDNDYD